MLADVVKFSDLCVLLSKLRDTSGANASAIRKKLFEKFVTTCNEKCSEFEDTDDVMYPVVRLVLSSLDPRSLNIKEKKLVDQVSKALALSPSSIRGVNVSNAMRVCERLADEVSSRVAPDDFEHLSITEINEKLDSLSAGLGDVVPRRCDASEPKTESKTDERKRTIGSNHEDNALKETKHVENLAK